MAQLEIIKEMLKALPDGVISDAAFEGANIVLYTKDKTFGLCYLVVSAK